MIVSLFTFRLRWINNERKIFDEETNSLCTGAYTSNDPLMILASVLFNCAFAENIKYGESWQVNPQKATITGTGSISSGYGSLSKNYYGYSLGGGVRAEWIKATNAFSGTVKIQLFKQSSPIIPIAQHSSPATFSAQSAGTTYQSGSNYVAGYAEPNLDILTTQKYMYKAVSSNIPNTVKIHYLCFLYYLG